MIDNFVTGLRKAREVEKNMAQNHIRGFQSERLSTVFVDRFYRAIKLMQTISSGLCDILWSADTYNLTHKCCIKVNEAE
jgi:hypothetical protein